MLLDVSPSCCGIRAKGDLKPFSKQPVYRVTNSWFLPHYQQTFGGFHEVASQFSLSRA